MDQESVQSRLRWMGIAVATTFVALAPTAYAALISNSVTLIADFLRSFAEFIAILLSWWVVRKISQSDTARFNYGFGKLEQLSSLVVAGALFMTFMVSFFCAVYRVIEPERLEGATFGFVFGALSVFGNGFLWWRYRQFYLTHPTLVMEAQWKLFRAKTFATLVVVLSLAPGVLLGAPSWSVFLDPLGSFLLSVFMLQSARRMLSDSMPDLIDRAVDESVQLAILGTLIQHEGKYVGFERLRTRRAGTHIHVQVFLAFSPSELFSTVLQTAEEIRKDLEAELDSAEVLVIPIHPH